MNIYYDTEFSGLKKDTSLISIGLVSEDGKELYLEFNDYNKDQCDDWIKSNVLDNTVMDGGIPLSDLEIEETNYHCGSKEELLGVLLNWLRQFDSVQLVSDVCHYDMVLFIDIFGSAFDLPKNICPCCHDINQDIANYYYIEEFKAFDLSREQILEDMNIKIEGSKHNSLYDARVIKAIYEIIDKQLLM